MTPTQTLAREIAALQRLTVKQLRQKYAEVFGEETNGHNKVWLVRRIAWRLQALAEGDLSDRARRWVGELACDADLRMNPPVPTPVAAEPEEAPPPRVLPSPLRAGLLPRADRRGPRLLLRGRSRLPVHHDNTIVLRGFARSIIRRKARFLVRCDGFTVCDLPDVEQELRLRLLQSLPQYDPTQGHINVFITTVVERSVAMLLRERWAKKRNSAGIESLDVGSAGNKAATDVPDRAWTICPVGEPNRTGRLDAVGGSQPH